MASEAAVSGSFLLVICPDCVVRLGPCLDLVAFPRACYAASLEVRPRHVPVWPRHGPPVTPAFAPVRTGPLTLIFTVGMPHFAGIARDPWGRPWPARCRCPEDPQWLQGQEGPKAIGRSPARKRS